MSALCAGAGGLQGSAGLPWVVGLSLAAFLVLGVAAFFQARLAALQGELAALQGELAALRVEFHREGLRAKVVRRRSAAEREGEAGRGAGVEAAHLQGCVPFQHVQRQGRIGPWYLTATGEGLVRLRGKGTEVEVAESGVYYVYAQVYYLTSQAHNSYEIRSYNGTEERKQQHRNLVTCSSQGRNSVGEVSCYTGLVASLKAGQRVYLNQIEQDRVIQFSNGCSYLGVVLLRKDAALERQ